MMKDPVLYLFLVFSAASYFAWWLMIPGCFLLLCTLLQREYTKQNDKKDDKSEQRIRALENQMAVLAMGNSSQRRI